MIARMLWALRRLATNRVVRSLAHAMAHVIYRGSHTYRVLVGPLRGYRWPYEDEHQFWMPLGAYETETVDWLRDACRPGDVVFDVGANAGYLALVGADAVGSTGQVVAFEPHPLNVKTLKRLVALNGIETIRIEDVAVSDSTGTLEFVMERSNANSHLLGTETSHFSTSPRGTLSVRATTLDDFVGQSGLIPDVLKVDVEGAESQVLAGARRTLVEHRPSVIVSTHNSAERARCRTMLEDAGYDPLPLRGFEHELIAHREG